MRCCITQCHVANAQSALKARVVIGRLTRDKSSMPRTIKNKRMCLYYSFIPCLKCLKRDCLHAQNQPGATIENKNEKKIDDGCSEQTFPKTCLKKFPRLEVKADVQKTIDEALFGLEGRREGSTMAPYCKRLRTLSQDPPDQINQGLHQKSGDAESRVYLSPNLILKRTNRVTRGA